MSNHASLSGYPVVIVISEQEKIINWCRNSCSSVVHLIFCATLADYEQQQLLFDTGVVLIDAQQLVFHNSISVCRKASFNPAHVIVLSQSYSVSVAGLIAAEGFAAYLVLPDSVENLIPTVVSVWDRITTSKMYVGAITPGTQYVSLLKKYAEADDAVLLRGETGTGKSFIARTLHSFSKRADKAFIGVNITSLSPSIIGTELFGCTAGAYTGAVMRKGFFEQAGEGTLFLDEIGDISLELQLSLLTVIDEGIYYRVGSSKPCRNHARLLFATNADLEDKISKKLFREDLYYRIQAFTVTIPPLRERLEEIPQLIDNFLLGSGKHLSMHALNKLYSYEWPGNVRELKNRIRRAVRLSEGDEISDVFAF